MSTFLYYSDFSNFSEFDTFRGRILRAARPWGPWSHPRDGPSTLVSHCASSSLNGTLVARAERREEDSAEIMTGDISDFGDVFDFLIVPNYKYKIGDVSDFLIVQGQIQGLREARGRFGGGENVSNAIQRYICLYKVVRICRWSSLRCPCHQTLFCFQFQSYYSLMYNIIII